MRVVIDQATLKRHRSCDVTVSPNWDTEHKSLVYEDWDKAVKNFLSTADGTSRLEWLVRHELVPMSADQFATAKDAIGSFK